ncbi:MAG: hypothetical protein J6C06_08780 [Lachnospiraceae bacterium]|nr:hypothetical protein [Lachnospiraceae bacterium]
MQIEIHYSSVEVCREELHKLRNDMQNMKWENVQYIGLVSKEMEHIVELYEELEICVCQLLEQTELYLERVVEGFQEVDQNM